MGRACHVGSPRATPAGRLGLDLALDSLPGVRRCQPTAVQRVVTLDMEGVLTPEIWVAVADHTGVDALRRTTRDEPDYQRLMDFRIGVLSAHGITLGDIQSVIETLPLLDGARDFLDALRNRYQVVLLSDTFEQFADHFRDLMGFPHLLCHRLDVADGRIVAFRPRVQEQKLRAVEAYRAMNYHVTAAGDSHNDVTMLRSAHAGCLFRAPVNLPPMYPELAVAETYDELLDWIDGVGPI